MKRTLVAVFVSLLLLSMTGCGGGGSSGGGGNGVVNPTPNPNPTPIPVPTPTPTPTPKPTGPVRLIEGVVEIERGEYVSLKVVDEETGKVPEVNDAIWIQNPAEPAGRFTNPNPGPAITAWQAPQRIFENQKFELYVKIPSLNFEGYAEVNVLVRSITEAEVKEIVRLYACVKDSDGNYRLARWIYKDVKVLVCPSSAADIEAVKLGSKWWQDMTEFGFTFDVQLTNIEYKPNTGSPNDTYPPPGTVAVINQPEGNPSAGRKNMTTSSPYTYDTGWIRFPTGKQPETIWHELWHILISDTGEPSVDHAFTGGRGLLFKAAIKFIYSHQPGDIV